MHRDRMRDTVILFLLFVATVVLAAILCHRRPAISTIETDISRLKDATVPSGARWIDSAPLDGSQTLATSWTFETSDSWVTYAQWTKDSVPSDFRPNPSTTQPSFTRSLSGDFQSLTVEKVDDGPPLRVRVTFTSIPN